jgi:hypothetical protein
MQLSVAVLPYYERNRNGFFLLKKVSKCVLVRFLQLSAQTIKKTVC